MQYLPTRVKLARAVETAQCQVQDDMYFKANEYMTKMQNFAFNRKTDIDGCWTFLKTYRGRIYAAKSFMRTSYPDEALLMTLTMALDKDNEYRSAVGSLASRDDLSVEPKVKALQEKEYSLHELVPTTTKTERRTQPDVNAKKSLERSDGTATLLTRRLHASAAAQLNIWLPDASTESWPKKQRIKDD
ncbi:hypothetical protein E4U60_007872 [Claviceps pazoutovae]|uniref:Uncharacterized protein n=1 Tax=Claviceps pazoutovae TaxID=1649127 RepID=A0A9P7SJ03_9HYPO|nr:hypothetical protein E4U60_007872 [Claviceps pazoutovae]